MSIRRAWQRFEVNFTGPFFTGQPVRAGISDYRHLQQLIGEELRTSSPGWDFEGIRWQGVESYGSGGGYSTRVPLVLATRQGDAVELRLEQLQRSRPAAEQEWLRRATAGWDWRLRAVKIEIYDFGVGTISGTYDVTAPSWLRAKDIRFTAESLARLLQDEASVSRSPVAAAYELLAQEAVGLFAAAVEKRAPEARQKPWLDWLLDALPPADPNADPNHGTKPAPAAEASSEWGRLLWLHPVFLFVAGEGAGARRLRRISAPFEATFSERIGHWHGLFTPGIDSSVVVLHRNRPKERTPPMHLTMLMWAYYGLFMEIDRGLLALLDSQRQRNPRSLSDLERDADRIFACYRRVREARARLDSSLADLAGGQLSMWNAIGRVQKFDELVAAVEVKVEVLQRIAERRVQEASAARARRTGDVLSALTALTVVTLAVAGLDTFLGTPTDDGGHPMVRAIAIGAAFVAAVLIYLVTRWQITRRGSG